LAETASHDLVVNRCVEFFNLSNTDLQQAVNDAHDPHTSFVPSGFTAANSAFVSGTTFLFGLDDHLNPEDPVAALRRTQCNAAFSPPQIAEREKCYRASAGHPNSSGAIQYKNQILAAMP